MYEKEIAWLLREKYQGKNTPEFERDVLRIISGEPVDYVIGYTDFLGARIYLSRHPLIPRPETEYWVGILIKRLMKAPPQTILDLFTGSGAIGVALGRAFPKSHVILSDINSSALEEAKENLLRNGVQGEIIQSNVFERIPGSFDLISANPPYIPHGSTLLSDSVREYEPHDALYAKEEGLEFIRELLENAGRYLNPGGTLAIEFDEPELGAIMELGKENAWRSEFVKDQYGRSRVGFFQK